jgi:hypothetical protein
MEEVPMKRSTSLSLLLLLLMAVASQAQNVPVKDDPLVRMPGSQPAPEGNVAMEAPGRCLNCHSGYNTEVEPGFNWKGSMMAQSARDFLFYACMTTAAQDSSYAIGRPNATDICLRCHFPKGWLEGRSEPTNATAMTGADYDGVQCDFCHTSFDPFFEETHAGTREGGDWLGYWDETNASSTPSAPAAAETHGEDQAQAQGVQLFNGDPFFDANLPPADYDENGSGQYFVSTGSQKRASFSDAAARHQMLYSRHHKSKYFCSTCHDVSNPILANYLLGGVGANETRADFGPGRTLWTEENPAYSYFHVERTFSEFMLSAYGQLGGAPTNPEFQAQGAPDITHAAKCQDCHMRDVVGVAANKNGAPVRPSESVEHPQSGQPLHDLTGGNVWVSTVLASAIPGSPNYESFNDQQLNQGPAVLTLDLGQGEGIDPVALLAGADRARQQLLLAATIKNASYDPATGELSFQVQNNSGHKLISGFPEGRRMFLNIKAWAAGSLIYEVNPYDVDAGTLKGLSYPYQSGFGLPDPQALGAAEAYVDELVYEMKPTSSADVPNAKGVGLTGEQKTFHFALATGRYKDNRIPPKGFDVAAAAARLSVPVWHGVEASDLYAAAEYTGGYDAVALTIPAGADAVEINLYYQTTSREYIEFLRDEINGTGNLTLPASAYIVQSDPFFAQLKAWGDTIWNLWTFNKDVEGAAPFLMASASVGAPPVGCSAPTPTLQSAVPGNAQVELTWSDEAAAGALGYMVYYDQAGKAQLVADAGNVTTHLDSGLTNGQEYCYKITSYDATCESGYSDILCAIPSNQGQATDPAVVESVETGLYSGKGRSQTYEPTTTFTAGDGVVMRFTVVDGVTGQPLADATVELLVTGPESVTLTTAPSDANGVAEAVWNTKSAGKRNPGTASGDYTVQTKNVAANGYHWDNVTTSTSFTLQ